jgi:NADPH-dependent curcumin reductase CurA
MFSRDRARPLPVGGEQKIDDGGLLALRCWRTSAVGEPTLDNFRSEKVSIPQPGRGQMLLRTLWLSLDPYMRGRMSDAPSYAKPVGIGDAMEGGAAA